MGIVDKILAVLYPTACPICGNVLSAGGSGNRGVCTNCEESLKFIGENHCLKCGKELSEEERFCYDCGRLNHRFDQAAAAFVYSDGIKQSIYRFKYKGKREYAAWYGKMLAKSCGLQISLWEPDVIVPIPLHAKKERRRGYNQAALLATELGLCTNIPVDERILKRAKYTVPMKSLKGEQRAKNLENAFIINDNSVKYNKVMLVDDIYTTGTTMDACAELLKDYGVKEVYGICLCVGKGI